MSPDDGGVAEYPLNVALAEQLETNPDLRCGY
jgi:hypothetical protein